MQTHKSDYAQKIFTSPWFSSGLIWIFLIGSAIRLFFLSQPMRGDEAYTFLSYVLGPWRNLLTYDAPNNHVLSTLLIRLSVLLGAHPATIRLPALLAGLASIPLGWQLAQKLHPRAGLLTAAAIAAYPYLILYATNARGYTLIIVCTLAMALVGLDFLSRPTRGRLLALGLLAALNLFTMPSAALAVAGIFTWLGLETLARRWEWRRILLDFSIPLVILTGILTATLYIPVVIINGGLAPIISNKFVQPQPWAEFLAKFLPQLGNTAAELSRDVPWPIILLLTIGLLYGAWQNKRMTTGMLLGAGIVLLIQHTNPYPRAWIYMLPLGLALADAGWSKLLEKAPLRAGQALRLGIAAITVGWAGWLAAGNVITHYPDTSGFPEAPMAVKYLKENLQPGDAVRALNTADWSVRFYFWYENLPYPETREKDAKRVFYIVKKSRYRLSDMTSDPAARLVVDYNDLALYESIKEK